MIGGAGLIESMTVACCAPPATRCGGAVMELFTAQFGDGQPHESVRRYTGPISNGVPSLRLPTDGHLGTHKNARQRNRPGREAFGCIYRANQIRQPIGILVDNGKIPSLLRLAPMEVRK